MGIINETFRTYGPEYLQQAGENFKLNRPIAERAPVDLIYQRHGVAECERHCQHDALADTPERGVDTITDIVKLLRHEDLEHYTKYTDGG